MGRLRGLMFMMLLVTAGVSVTNGAVTVLLTPLQLANLDPANKVALLAIASSVGSIASMVVQPVVGRLSDGARTKFGRRVPIMLLGAVLAGASLLVMAISTNVGMIIFGVIVLQLALQVVTGPLAAVMPDRVPRGVRGMFSAVVGLGSLVGSVLGQTVGALLASNITLGYLIFAGFVPLTVIAFAIFTPDRSSLELPRTPFSVRSFAGSFWVSPRKYPDFFWAFTGRILMFGGYYLLASYSLYILQDYIGLGDEAVALVPMIGAVAIVTVILSSIVSGSISDRIGRRKPVVLVTGIILAVSLIIPWFMPTVPGMVIHAVLSGLGFGGYLSVDAALMSEVLPSEESHGKDLGVLGIASNLPQVLGPAVAGVIIVSFGYALIFPLAFVLSLAGALVILRIRSVK